KFLLQALGGDAAEDVGRAAWGEGHDDVDRPIGPSLRRPGRSSQGHAEQPRRATEHDPSPSAPARPEGSNAAGHFLFFPLPCVLRSIGAWHGCVNCRATLAQIEFVPVRSGLARRAGYLWERWEEARP